MSVKPHPARGSSPPRPRWFGPLLGAVLGIALLKFGTAAIMEGHIGWPKNGYEWAIDQWPVTVGYGLLAAVLLLGATVAGWEFGKHRWLVALPAAWFLWQLLAATRTVDATLTTLTLKHFIACLACFYLGFFALSRAESLGGFWGPLVGALLLVGVDGFDQHFGGLAETREFLLKNEATHWRECPPEQVAEMERDGLLIRTPEGYTANPSFLKKAQSSRISATLFYPNALAGAVLLLLPGALVTIVRTGLFTSGAKGLVGGVLGGGALACLYWSGSKAGWLLALVLAMIALWRSSFERRMKLGVILGLMILGGVGFAVKYTGFFQRGATSVVARFDYWEAAWRTANDKPWLGTGPGTFSRPYQLLKKPESEMARLTHNDYLQQASDSGWPGCAFYSVLVVGVLIVSGRRVWAGADWESFCVWLGVLGWALQGLVEFGLYIPALAWPAFVMLGWLLARASQIGSTKPVTIPKLTPRT